MAQAEKERAGCQRAEAELVIAKAKLELADADFRRVQDLEKTKAIANADVQAAAGNLKTAKAGVLLAEASLAQGRSALKLAELNLSYTVIRSPVKGVIIDRRVNVGQTVVAALNAPTLFLIAKDLKRMQVWVAVNEADIGQIKEKQPARFTVDAYPGKTFEGVVAKVRLNATMTQNVVTYTVIVTADNADEKLLPYLTANVRFEVACCADVLRVPNAALRWQPRSEKLAEAARPPQPPADAKSKHIWVQEGDDVRPLEVQTGATDGSITEISGKDVKEGMQVIVGTAPATTLER